MPIKLMGILTTSRTESFYTITEAGFLFDACNAESNYFAAASPAAGAAGASASTLPAGTEAVAMVGLS